YFPTIYDAATNTEWTRMLGNLNFLPKFSDTLRCPSVPPFRGDPTLPYSGYRYTYGMPSYKDDPNATFCSDFPTVTGSGYIIRSRIQRPAQIFLAADSWSAVDGYQ